MLDALSSMTFFSATPNLVESPSTKESPLILFSSSVIGLYLLRGLPLRSKRAEPLPSIISLTLRARLESCAPDISRIAKLTRCVIVSCFPKTLRTECSQPRASRTTQSGHTTKAVASMVKEQIVHSLLYSKACPVNRSLLLPHSSCLLCTSRWFRMGRNHSTRQELFDQHNNVGKRIQAWQS